MLAEEQVRLRAARAQLTGRITPTEPATAANGDESGRVGARRGTDRRARNGSTRQPGVTRAQQAQALIEEHGPLTIPQLARMMRIKDNYLYRALPKAGFTEDPGSKRWTAPKVGMGS